MPNPPTAREIDFAEIYQRLERAEAALQQESVEPQRRREVLAERARELAAVREETRAETVSLMAFSVGGERYAMAMDQVEQVLALEGLSPIPGAPRQVLGAMVARSRAVLVFDLRQLLGLDTGIADLHHALVVARQDERWALAAESVEGRIEVLRAELTAAAAGPFLAVTPDRLAILDLDELASRGGGAT